MKRQEQNKQVEKVEENTQATHTDIETHICTHRRT